MFLSYWNKALRQLHANLAASATPYAELVGLVERRSRLAAAGCEVTTSAAEITNPLLDDGDNDPPVSWNAPPHQAPARSGSRC